MSDDTRNLMMEALSGEYTTNKYYAKLGRFITAYASAEALVHLVLRFLSKMEDGRARVVFGGLRIHDATGLIRAFLELDPLPDGRSRRITDCLDHLSKLQDKRHKLVHRDVTYENEGFVASNKLTAKHVTMVETDRVTGPELEAMKEDCVDVYIKLLDALAPGVWKGNDWAEPRVQQPWRYKRAPRANRSPSPGKARKSKLRRPDASHG